jgi:RNA polymerase sigma-70 factor (ECF subfamily)
MSDADLVAAARLGEERAFDVLFQRHYPRIVNLALRLQGNLDDAEDIAQVAFVRAHAHLSRIRDGQALLAWLYRTVVNEVRDRAKARQRRPWFSFGDISRNDDDEDTVGEPRDDSSDPAKIVIKDSLNDALTAAIGRLPLEFREAVVMHHLEQMDVGQIGETLGVPVGTVKSRLSRGRALLRKELAPWLEA